LVGLLEEASSWTMEFVSGTGTIKTLSGRIGSGERKWVGCEFPAGNGDTVIRIMVRGAKIQNMERFTDGNDKRMTSIGFYGFYLCDIDNLAARANFAEAALTNELHRL